MNPNKPSSIYTTLRQRLIAVQILSHEHHISTLCRVLMVNRSTYYKFLNHTPSARDKDNAYIRSCIIAKSCRTFFSIYVLFLIYFQERLLLISFRVRMILSWLLVLYMAVQNRNINPKGIIFHSDCGAQFTSKVFRV